MESKNKQDNDTSLRPSGFPYDPPPKKNISSSPADFFCSYDLSMNKNSFETEFRVKTACKLRDKIIYFWGGGNFDLLDIHFWLRRHQI